MGEGGGEFPHGNVNVEEIKQISVVPLPRTSPVEREEFAVTFSLPTKTSLKWQSQIRIRPTGLTGLYGGIDPALFEFNKDGNEMSIFIMKKLPEDLLEIVRRYAQYANDRYQKAKEGT